MHGMSRLAPCTYSCMHGHHNGRLEDEASLLADRYLPQIVLNHRRQSTAGWNVSSALTDMCGGLLSMVQQLVDAYAVQVRPAFTDVVDHVSYHILSLKKGLL